MNTPEVCVQQLRDLVDSRSNTLDRIFPQVYSELKRLAAYHLKNERANHTLRPTELVHEVYVLLRNEHSLKLDDRRKFMSLASTIMRHVLVNYAKHRKRKKRGEGLPKVPIDSIKEITLVQFEGHPVDFIVLDDALNELEKRDPRQVRIVELRYLGGLTFEEIAEELGISSRTAKRDWKFAKAWLYARLTKGGRNG